MNDLPQNEPTSRGIIAAFVIVALAIVGGAVLVLASRPQPVQITINPPAPTATPLPTDTPAPLTVYVTGAVNEPFVTLALPPGSRVQDALDAAGGTTENADMTRVNVAQVLRDGDQVHVPAMGEAVVATATASGGTVVYINTANSEELETLPGVGPALAQRIIEFREENGPFTSLEELDAVSGIGPALLENLAGLVVFD